MTSCSLVTSRVIEDDVSRCGPAHQCFNRFRLDLACSTRVLIWRRHAGRHGLPIDDDDGLIREIDDVLQFFRSLRSAYFCSFAIRTYAGGGGGDVCAWNQHSNILYRCTNSWNYDLPSFPYVHLQSADVRRSLRVIDRLIECLTNGWNVHSLSWADFNSFFGRHLSHVFASGAFHWHVSLVPNHSHIGTSIRETLNTTATRRSSFIPPFSTLLQCVG